MANETFRLDAEFVVDATQAIKNFRDTEKSARALEGTLISVGKAAAGFEAFAKKKGNVSLVTEKSAKDLERTLKVYKQLTDVVTSYGRAAKNLQDVDPSKSQHQLESSLKGVARALASVSKMTKADAENVNRTLSVYKQIVDVHLKRTQALNAETAALKKKNAQEAKAAGGRSVDAYNLVGQASSSNTNEAQRARALHQLGKLQDAAYKEERRRQDDLAKQRQKYLDDNLAMLSKVHQTGQKFTKDQQDAQQRLGSLQSTAQKQMAADFARRDRDYEKRARSQLIANGQLARDEVAMAQGAARRSVALRQATAAITSQTAATKSNAAATRDANAAHGGTRYALYDVAGAYGAVAAAASAAAVGAAAVAVQYERQFADVSRTTMADPAALAEINEEFLNLSTSIPVTFEELTKIGTIGAQMGVAEENLGQFAETVSVFSMTTNAGVTETAMAFGRLDNMLDDVSAETYPRLASAIAEVGTASVATETEILTTAESIATTAGMAGYTADQVVGLATAMASLKVRPELARGALQRIFAGINKAVAAGGEDLNVYAAQVDMTAQEFANLWANDPSRLFQNLAQSLNGLDKVQVTQVLGQLGINNTRDVEMLSRLANGYETYAGSMDLAAEAYARGDFLDEASARIFETTAATLIRLGNAFKEFLATFGGGALSPIKETAEILISVLGWLTELPDGVQTSALAVIAIVGAFAAFKAALALSTAGVIAFRQVLGDAGMQGGVSIANLRKQFALLRGEMVATKASAAGVATSVAAMNAHMSGASVASTRLRGGLGSVVGLLGGPWGIALTVATVGLSALISSQADARAEVDLLTDALDAQTGALSENGEAHVWDNLVNEGVIDRAKRLGISLDDLREAAVDPTSKAFEELEAAADKAFAERNFAESAAFTGTADEAIAATRAGKDWFAVMQAVEGQHGNILAAQERSSDAQKAGVETTDLLGAKTEEMGEDFELAAGDVDTLTSALDAAVNAMFGIIGAEAEVQSSLQSLGESVADNGIDFSINTEGGRANIAALQSTVEAFSAYMAAEVEQGNLTADEAAAQFAGYVDSLLLQLEQMGVDPAQFVDFRNVLGEIFENNPVAVALNTEPALQNLSNLAAYGQAVFAALYQNGQGVSRGMAASGARYAAQGAAHKARQGQSSTYNGVTVGPAPKQVKANPFKPIDYAALSYGNATRAAENFAKAEEKAASEAEKAGRAAEKAAEDTKTAAEEAADYIQRLGQAFTDSINKRYGQADARDALEQQFINMKKRVQDAKDEIVSLRDEQRKLLQEAADARIEARQAGIFAGVAEQYGDTERALDYRNQQNAAKATVAEKERLASAAGREAAEIQKNYLALTGYSEAAIANRAEVRNLQTAMADLIREYAATGASQTEVAEFTRQLENRFKTQLTQMGYNERQVTDLSGVFKDLRRDVLNVPTKVKVTATAETKTARANLDALSKPVSTEIKPFLKSADLTTSGNMTVKDVRANKLDAMEVTYGRHFAQGMGGSGGITRARGGIIPGDTSGNKYQDNLIATGHNYDGLVTVRSGEGILNRQAVQHYGPDYVDALNNMRVPQFTQAVSGGMTGGGGSSGPTLVELLPYQINAIAKAVSTIVAVDGNVIAQTTNAHNAAAARRGTN